MSLVVACVIVCELYVCVCEEKETFLAFNIQTLLAKNLKKKKYKLKRLKVLPFELKCSISYYFTCH